MKLILTQEVGNLGGPGDLVEVKDGYGRNYLVPRGLAIVATRGAEKQVSQIRRAREVRDIRDLGQAREVAASLAALPVRLSVRAGNGGRLFGSVTSAMWPTRSRPVVGRSSTGGASSSPSRSRSLASTPSRCGCTPRWSHRSPSMWLLLTDV